MELEFSIATKEDLNCVMAMYTAAVNEMIRLGIDQWDSLYPDRNILENDISNKQLYLGVWDGIIVSAYVLNQECDEQYVHDAWKYPYSTFYVIHRLCVSPEFQNKKIGTLTIHHIENEVHKMGIETIRLDAFTLNPYALKMYENLGYIKIGYAHWRKGEFYLMEKRI